jgi:hypothetical protein
MIFKDLLRKAGKESIRNFFDKAKNKKAKKGISIIKEDNNIID